MTAIDRKHLPIRAEIDRSDSRLIVIALYLPGFLTEPYTIIQPALARALGEDLINLAELAEQ